ncbi:putative quinol monooxygenase [Enterobacillus tribolii]|uniref:Quinol monooxygenase YgiN n=1 Tax=Enterobacillus tribolii TaxID=1487935 RepID=A0A370R1Z9_9GAMM|nr:putative quinol monooxygenase [Enterobacillus tribolii]MBW7982944.1 antibiotic biosynthesis monooxygenase [Enterobacillus tribolii]RDK95953.1 quinol monooxygenase YgiN [Enterobacillus tribolii]
MSEVNVVALIVALPEHRAAVDKAVRAMVAPTHTEPGCIQYDLHEETEHPGSFVFIERWKSEQALKEHMAMPYHDAFLAELNGKLAKLEVKKLVRL